MLDEVMDTYHRRLQVTDHDNDDETALAMRQGLTDLLREINGGELDTPDVVPEPGEKPVRFTVKILLEIDVFADEQVDRIHALGTVLGLNPEQQDLAERQALTHGIRVLLDRSMRKDSNRVTVTDITD